MLSAAVVYGNELEILYSRIGKVITGPVKSGITVIYQWCWINLTLYVELI